MQFERCDANDASVMKYASHVGRRRIGEGRSRVERKVEKLPGVVKELRIWRCACEARCAVPRRWGLAGDEAEELGVGVGEGDGVTEKVESRSVELP